MKAFAEILRMCVAASLLFTATVALGFAPSPFAKPARRDDKIRLPLVCEMHWNHSVYQTQFRADGTYQASSEGSCTWYGSWSYEPKTKLLRIIESVNPDNPDGWSTYDITLDLPSMTGVIKNVGRFALK